MISVVIPTHNRSKLLKRAVDSVLEQSIEDLEIIVVSDGSIDETDEIMSHYSDERINYISYFPAMGGNAARNRGIKEAKYDYIAFLDDDDEWTTDKLSKQINVFQENEEIGLVYTGIKHVYGDYNLTYTTTPSEKGDLSKKFFIRIS